jgi:hypothetical protein
MENKDSGVLQFKKPEQNLNPKNMSQTKHTPGPWRVEKMDDTFIRCDDNGNGTIVCVIRRSTIFSDANAKLIASSPAMLEFLEEKVKDLEYGASDGMTEKGILRLAKEMREIIQKATE